MNNVIKAKVIESETLKAKMNNSIVYEQPAEIEELVDDINNEEVEGTVIDKLNYLDDTKGLIKMAVTRKGVEIEDNDPFRSYADKISSIPAGEPELEVGGKNPVLIGEYVEEIPFSETNYPQVTPTTSYKTICDRKIVLTKSLDLNAFDYVVVHFVYIKPIYTEELPITSSYIKKSAFCSTYNYYATDKIYNAECVLLQTKTQMEYHKANNSNTLHTEAYGIRYNNPTVKILMDKRTAEVYANEIQISIQANYMTADAWEKIDAEKSTVTFDIKFYQVDKGTTPIGHQIQNLMDYIYGG